VIEYRDKVRGGIPSEELPKAREEFKKFAKYYAEVIAHPDVWNASRDIKFDPATSLIPPIDGPYGILHDLNRFVIDPAPSNRQLNVEPAVYLRELGAALDDAFKPLIESHPERIVRINAARVLAHVARTGAPAHFATVVPLIANANTPTEIKYYMLQAAAALLSAPDMNDPRVRKHAGDPKVIGELVKALQDCVSNPAMILPGYKAETASAEQLPVIALVRRQAIRALAQVKFVVIPGPDGRTPIYPAYTLVRVAMSDPALTPPPGPADVAEAIIGLCNMAPMQRQGDSTVAVRGYNIDVVLEAMLQGLVTFAGPRAANPSDRSLPWRGYVLRMAESMQSWQALFDPNFDPQQPKRFDPSLVPPVVVDIFKLVSANIFAPIDKVDLAGKPDPTAVVQLNKIQDRLTKMRSNPNRKKSLFEGVKETSIEFAPPEK